MKNNKEQELQFVTLLSQFSDVLGNISNEEVHPPKFNESNGASKMQELIMGQIISETKEDTKETTPKEAGEDSLSKKSTIWQENHSKIQLAILQSISGKGKMPSKPELSRYTGLSRQAIYEHLKDDATTNLYKAEISKVRLLSSVLLSKLTELALQGELKALKMILDLIRDKQSTNTTAQNNFIQVNNTKIDKLVVERLSESALGEIEVIINRELNSIEPQT